MLRCFTIALGRSNVGVAVLLDYERPFDSLLGIADDIVVLKDETHPTWMWGVKVSDIDQRYLIVDIAKDSSRVSIYFALTCSSVSCYPINPDFFRLERTSMDRGPAKEYDRGEHAMGQAGE